MKNEFPRRTTLAYLKQVQRCLERELAVKRRKAARLDAKIRALSVESTEKTSDG